MIIFIRDKATGWVGRFFSLNNKFRLVKHILSSMPIQNMSVYRWHISVVKENESYIRNFSWSGDPGGRKRIVVGCKKVTKPHEEGGMSIKYLRR